MLPVSAYNQALPAPAAMDTTITAEISSARNVFITASPALPQTTAPLVILTPEIQAISPAVLV